MKPSRSWCRGGARLILRPAASFILRRRSSEETFFSSLCKTVPYDFLRDLHNRIGGADVYPLTYIKSYWRESIAYSHYSRFNAFCYKTYIFNQNSSKIISKAFRFAARHCSLTADNLTNNHNAITDLHCIATQNFLQICNFLLGLLKSLVWDQTFGQDESFERRR